MEGGSVRVCVYAIALNRSTEKRAVALGALVTGGNTMRPGDMHISTQ